MRKKLLLSFLSLLNTKPIVVSNKAYIEDARKWLDTAVKPLWEN